jgi:hypothetical protein
MAFTEFFCRASGSNLNGGALSTGAEPATTAAYTSTSGNWSTVTNQFTPTDGSTPASTVTVGDFASIYINAATTAVYIARVTVVAAGVNGAITVSTTSIYGTAPTTNSGSRSIKVGGAWLGPNGAATFPFGLAGTIGALKNSSSDQVRLNAKNDQTYTMTSALPFTTLGNAVIQGYTGSAGDLGKAIFTSNITTGANFTNVSTTSTAFVDLIFANTGASNANHLVLDTSDVDTVYIRNVFHGARGCGFAKAATNGPNVYLMECEAYDCNKSNTAATPAIAVANPTGKGGAMLCYNTYSHDNTGSNASGFGATNTSGLILINCISDTNGGNGAVIASGGRSIVSINSNYYNNTGDGINLAMSSAQFWALLFNNNFIKNTGAGVNNTVTSQGGILYNNGRGSGTQANGSADTLKSIANTSTDVTFASGVTPWVAPTTGNFSTNLAAAMAAGRGVFTETDGTNTGTAGYPDIGAAESRAAFNPLATTIIQSAA